MMIRSTIAILAATLVLTASQVSAAPAGLLGAAMPPSTQTEADQQFILMKAQAAARLRTR